MPALIFLFALLRVAILVAIVLAVAAVVYYRHQTQQLALQVQDLKTHVQQLQQRDTQRTESFATTVHELRAPLTSIRGALVLLSAAGMGSLDERAVNLLRIATGNTGRLVRLIDELLDIERIESGEAPLELQPCSLDVLLAHAVDAMAPMAQESAIEIHTTPYPAAPLLFLGNPCRTEQVLCNLLSNAIKFSSHGSLVTLTLRAEPYHLVLRIQDEGCGVPANKLEAIFNRFVRIDAPLSAHAEFKPRHLSIPSGSGLGLAISRSLVAQHGGTLHAERNDSIRPGRNGTTFVLRLPRLLAGAALVPPPTSAMDADSSPETIPAVNDQKDAYERSHV